MRKLPFGNVEKGETVMKSYRKELSIETKKRSEIVRITEEVQQAITESGVCEGLVLVNAVHTTAGVFINVDEPGLYHDLEVLLEKLAPEKPYDIYWHNGVESNADAHLKRSLIGREAVCAITEGKLDFGTAEQVLYFDLDGKREKKVLIKIIGE